MQKKFQILLFLAFLFPAVIVSGQEKFAGVSGTITDSSGNPVENATVSILKSSDSSKISTTYTSRKGKFLFRRIKPGNYLLLASNIGFGSSKLSFSLSNDVDLGLIMLNEIAVNLKEVLVTSTRALQANNIDRKIYNVSQDILAQTNSAADVLRNIPSVEVDLEGQVSLRGSGDMQILINGRRSQLMGNSRADVLQQLPANSIERIEVITNPSAKFEPDGTSGIINIILKKNARLGWNGTVNANAGSNQRYNAGLSLNYKPGKFNLFTSYNFRHDRRFRKNETERYFSDSLYKEYSTSHGRPNAHLLHAGIDFTPGKSNELGLSGSYFDRGITRTDLSERFGYNLLNELTERFDRLRDSREGEIEKEVTGHWKHHFNKKDHELQVEITMASGSDRENNIFTTQYSIPQTQFYIETIQIKELDDQQEISIDYSRPLNEESMLETGYEGSFNQIDLDYINSDPIKSNRFKYNESIHAFYSTYEKELDDFGIKAGLRAEQVYLNGDLVTKDSAFSNNYFRIYPTLHLSWEVGENELQLNYSKRVNRPDGDELNPFPEYQDPYNLRAGNTQLLPEIIHSVELGYKFGKSGLSFLPSLYYRYRKNGFTSVTRPLNDTVLLTTEENLGTDHTAGIELILSAKPGRKFTANLNTNFFYNQIDASALGFSSNKSIISMSSNFNTSFELFKNNFVQITSNFRSARLTPQGSSYGSLVVNGGIKQDLFKSKLSITLTVSDILKSQRQKSVLESIFFNQTNISRRDGRIIFLGLSYKFGGLTRKDENKLEFDDTL